MKSAEQMTKELQDVFEKLKAGEIKPAEAAELNNCVGKMRGLAQTQLEYYAMRKETPKIRFLECGEPAERT